MDKGRLMLRVLGAGRRKARRRQRADEDVKLVEQLKTDIGLDNEAVLKEGLEQAVELPRLPSTRLEVHASRMLYLPIAKRRSRLWRSSNILNCCGTRALE